MRNPWDDVPRVWKNEKQYLNWLRSQVRRVWSRHPVKNEYKSKHRYRAPVGKPTKKNPKGMVWVLDCENCGKQHRNCEVDHLDGGYGFTTWEEFMSWTKRILWVTFDDIRVLCPPCHATITYMQKTGLSFEEAEKKKVLIAKLKQRVADQKKELSEAGFSEEEISNKDKREQCYMKLLKENE